MSIDHDIDPADLAAIEREIAKAIQHVDTDELRDLLRSNAELEEIKAKLGPQNAEELWHWVKDRVGVELSRVTVCPGHCSQLEMAWELYSFAVNRVLWVMSRGGGKTSLVAWIDECQAEHFPGWAAFTIGANQTQGQRKYEYLLPLVVEGGVIGGKELDHVERSIATETQLKNGSKMEIARGSSPENANGPRVPRLHRDETELMDPKTRKQAGNIPAGRKTRDGRYVPAQILDTSTMKYAEGLIDKTIQEYKAAKEKGVRPQMEVRICCLFEVAAENPYCRSVPDEQRRARLIKLGLDPDKRCNCETYVSDVWPVEDTDEQGEEKEPEPRTLESVCQGRFFRSRGYKRFDDVQTLFLENDRETWQAEQECAQPATEGAYIKSYTHVRNGIKGYSPDPENGPIDMGLDWGSDDEHAVIWFQVLERPVRVKAFVGDKTRVLQPGALVAFAEIFKKGIGNVELGHMVIAREQEWVIEYPGWRVHERYPDSANLGARLDWKNICGLPTQSRIRKDFLEELKMVRTRIGTKGGFFVDVLACPWFDKAIRGWRQENGREVRNFACLVAGTRVRTEHGEVPIEDVVAGDRVWTREGLKSVTWSGPMQTDQTVFVEAEGADVPIECTPDHPFWTQRGWVEAQDLTHNDKVLSWRSFEKSGFRSTLSIEGGGSIETPRATTRRASTFELAASSCIERSGRTSGARFPRVTRSIISMATPTTTPSATSLLSRSSGIDGSNRSALAANVSSIILHAFVLLLTLRCAAQMFARVHESVLKSSGRSVSRERLSASIATESSRRQQLDRFASAVRTAGRLSGGRVVSTMKSVRVDGSDASRSSSSASTAESASAGDRVLRVINTDRREQVYDLCVEDCHEFFANGILTHNTHPMAAFRYREHNVHVLERKAAGAKKASNPNEQPMAAEDEEEREWERSKELARTGVRGASVELITDGAREPVEDLGIAMAEESPYRDAARNISRERVR